MRFKRIIINAACSAALVSFSTAQISGRQRRPEIPPTPVEDVADSSAFDPIPSVSYVCRKLLKRCGAQMLKETSSGGYGDPGVDAKRATRQESFTLDNGATVFLLTVMNDAPESVAGERFRVEFNPIKGGHKLTRVGRQYKCVRGPQNWTKELCP